MNRPRFRLANLGLAATLLFAASTPAHADIQRIGLTSFDRIEVVGDMTVEVRSGHAIGATAEGSRDALDGLQVEVVNRALQIRQLPVGRFGPRRADAGPVIVRVSAQNLSTIILQGAGRVTVDGLRSAEAQIFLNGAGTMTVRAITAQQLNLRTTGNGTMALSGQARSVQASINGAGGIDAQALAARDVRVVAVGAGQSRFQASGMADLQVTGTGGVIVGGRPRCTVRNLSSGTVLCGNQGATVTP